MAIEGAIKGRVRPAAGTGALSGRLFSGAGFFSEADFFSEAAGLDTFATGLERLALMRSFMILLALKTITRRGVIGTVSPVLGFLPTRSDFWRSPKEPKDESLINSPRSRAWTICFRTSSTSSAASFRGKPTFSKTASAKSARVSVLPLSAMMRYVPPRRAKRK